ncbi:hypothetical protein ACQ4PT_024903 [Festuca glaucescens]
MEACFPCLGARKRPPPVEATPGDPQHRNVAARTFSFEELAAATRHFRDGCLVADHSPDKARLDWSTRMNIAAGVARGLEYLHDRGMVYRCMRSSDILLGDGDGYYPKLSQYGLAELGQHLGETDEAFTTTYLDDHRAQAFVPGAAVKDRDLVTWAGPLMKDTKELRRMADPALQGRYPSMDLEAALAVASMCIHQHPAMRSPIGAVVAALARLAIRPLVPVLQPGLTIQD